MLKKIIKTVTTMLADREYNIIKEVDPFGLDMLIVICALKTNEEDHKEEEEEDKLFVFFPREPKLSIKTKRQILKKINFDGSLSTRVIFVTARGSTSFASKEIALNDRQQMFRYDELVVPVVQHHLVPKHRLLSTDEVKKLFPSKKYKQELPRINTTDAVVKYLGLCIDDVIEISRIGIEGNTYKFYRIVS
mgnify:CR=1 FL=1